MCDACFAGLEEAPRVALLEALAAGQQSIEYRRAATAAIAAAAAAWLPPPRTGQLRYQLADGTSEAAEVEIAPNAEIRPGAALLLAVDADGKLTITRHGGPADGIPGG